VPIGNIVHDSVPVSDNEVGLAPREAGRGGRSSSGKGSIATGSKACRWGSTSADPEHCTQQTPNQLQAAATAAAAAEVTKAVAGTIVQPLAPMMPARRLADSCSCFFLPCHNCADILCPAVHRVCLLAGRQCDCLHLWHPPC
jgi:hypothetical protein